MLLFAAGLGTDSAEAQVATRFAVTSAADTTDAQPGDGVCADDSGACSLRAAIQEANTSDAPASVTVPPGTYLFTRANTDGDEDAGFTGDLDVSSQIRIAAFGATINADWLDRAFEVTADGELVISGATIINGYARGGEDPIVGSGGAIWNAGSTTVQLSSFVGNRAEGPAASGGAILNTGDLTVNYSTFEANRATRAGGAIEANGGSTTILGSSFTANKTGPEPGNGGAFHLSGAGDVLITSSTFTDNLAVEGGAVWNSASGSTTVTDSLFTTNQATGVEADQGGGGLYNDGGTLIVADSTMERNSATGAAGSGGAILNNGGRLEIETSVISGNSAERAGGGIEANLGTTTIVSTVLDGNDAGASPGNGGALHITGAGDATITTSDVVNNTAGAEGGGLWNGTATMTITDSRIEANEALGAEADQGGGGVFNAGGTIMINGGVINDNTARGTSGSGGGVLNDQGTATITATVISSNQSSRAGGGIESNVGVTTLEDVVLIANTTGAAPGNGGGFHITGAGDADITNTEVLLNTASAEGGGLWNGTGTMVVTDSRIVSNTASGVDADQGGGGLFNAGGILVVEGGVVSNNDADGAAGSGGGILNDRGELSVTGTTIAYNSSVRAGGGIESVGGAEAPTGATTLVDVALRHNTTGDAPGNGGAFHLSANSVVAISGGTVIGNAASNEGGGLWNSASGTMTVTGVAATANRAPIGPDIYTQPGGDLTVTG